MKSWKDEGLINPRVLCAGSGIERVLTPAESIRPDPAKIVPSSTITGEALKCELKNSDLKITV